MKKLLLFAVIFLFAAAAVAQQSLGDIARDQRAKKRGTATTRLNDDNFTRSSTPSTSPAAAEPKKNDEKSGEAKDASAREGKKDLAEAQKKTDNLKSQIENEKKEIATLQRELDVAQRESRLRAAS